MDVEKIKIISMMVVVVLVGCLMIVSTITGFYAMYECGFTNSLLYGRNIFWAWYFGYC